MRISQIATSTALSWALLASAAHADLTAEQVWGDWRDYLQGLGYTVTADETASGGALSVADITIAMPVQAGASATFTMGSLTFKEVSDGSVEIVMPDVMPMQMSLTDPKGKPGAFDMSLIQSGQQLTASGSPENIVYDYSAATYTVRLDRMVADGEELGTDNARMNISGKDLSMRTSVAVNDSARNYAQTLSSGPITLDLFIAPPGEPGTVEVKGRSASLSFSGTSVVPKGMMDTSDFTSLMKSGFAVDGTFAFGPGGSEMAVTAPEGPSQITTSSEGGSLNVRMDANGISYGGKQRGIAMQAQMAQVPFPITASIMETGFQNVAPLTKSDTAQDFVLNVTLRELKMSDMIWGIFDPTGQLPRDPATLVIEMSGKARMLVDFLDPEAAERMAATGATPAEIEKLSIDSLHLSAVGAEFTGNGEIAFDNSDKVTMPGMPKPVGAVNLRLRGGNGLLDKLVGMGVIPQDQAMGARMMMGLFAVPDEGDDNLKSTIEFTENGQILANGQRIK